MKAIHQIVAGFRSGDAICEEALLLRGLFISHGFASEIFCDASGIHPDSAADVADLDTLASRLCSDDIVILHLSIGCRANLVFPSLLCRRCILYHNVTPARYFERLNPRLAKHLEEGREQVAALRDVAEINLAVSSYNADELRAMGYRDISVLPLIVNTDFHRGGVDERLKATLTNDGYLNILFVGRVVPNKRHDRLLQVFHYFQHVVEPHSRLIIAGSSLGCEAYKILLLGTVDSLGLKHVKFTEFLSDAELNACYASASAFLCMSDHEGFCAPLLEAMSWNIPVFAHAAAAVPETLAGAGVLFDNADPATIAETIGHILRDATLRNAVLERQQARLAQYRSRDVWRELTTLLFP